jgi:hypothetical protein
MQMSEPKVEGIASAAEFIKRAIALRLSLNRIGSRRAVNNDDVDLGDAESDRISITKEILQSPELNAIRNHDLETRAAIRVRSLPSLLGSGWYLIPVAAVDPIDEFIRARADARADLVEALVAALPELKKASEAALGHLWDAAQFPDAGLVRDKSRVAFKYVTFDTPATLKGISSALLAREVQKAKVEAASARDAAVALLRDEMKRAVAVLADAFVPGPNGRKKGLKPATLDKVTQALDLFAARNIAQDDQLAAFVAQAKALISGKDAATIKAEAQDGGIIAQFQAIKASVSTLVEEGPSRTIDFEE